MSEHPGKTALENMVRAVTGRHAAMTVVVTHLNAECITDYVSDLESRLEKAEEELGIRKVKGEELFKRLTQWMDLADKARTRALKEAESVIEARISIYTEIGQLNALRECLSSIRALKSSPPSHDGDAA